MSNLQGTTPLFLPPLDDQFSRGKNNGATTIIIYQPSERSNALVTYRRLMVLEKN
jgi:hypothetical protein